MAVKSTRDALLAAAYHSRKCGFTPRDVTKAFKPTGLRPLDTKVVLSRAFDNLGVATVGETARNEARMMGVNAISEA